MSYTITVTRQRREGYNRGGDAFTNAPQIFPSVEYWGTLAPHEDGQYFKIRLNAGGSATVSGTLFRYRSGSASFDLIKYDSSFSNPVTLVNNLLVSSTSSPRNFPTSGTITITNSGGSPADFYLKLKVEDYPIHDFKLVLNSTTMQSPTLTLFLDADVPRDFNATAAAPENDVTTFVPGASMSDGVSLAVPATGTLIQQVELIAAYVGANGTIVPPPNTATVVFTLYNPDDQTQTSMSSAFAGIAMNWGDPQDFSPDFALAGGGSSNFGGDYTARVTVQVRDYGGFATVFARHGLDSGQPTAQIKLPNDVANNWLPDAGWRAQDGTGIADTGQNSDDTDNDPTVSDPPVVGKIGDGLTRLEEYRGFVTRGVHIRTNPSKKDLFVSSYVQWMAVDFGLEFASPNMPIAIHRVWGEDENPASPEYSLELNRARVVNHAYQNTGFGGNPSIHWDQKALRMYGASPITLGATFPIDNQQCVSDGGMSPNEVFAITLNLQLHQTTGTNRGNTQAQINNEIRRTIGHEIGHGVHVKHRNDAHSCDDGAVEGTAASIMDSNWYDGPGATDPRSQYNSADVQQIRLHLRP